MEAHSLTIKEVSGLLAKKEISSVELAKELLGRTSKLESKLHAFLYVAEQEALKGAAAADQMIADGEKFPLTGIPYAVKDNILVEGFQATAGSKILENYVAPYDATVIKKLRQVQPVFMGKTNLDEFGMGSSTENSAYGPTLNPYDPTRVAGGSSGGSAAAVASGEVLFALGTDTGGSVRTPASFCGVVGLKPTFGRCSRYGLIALGSSLDQPGVLAKTVEDSFLVLQLIAGQDEFDSTSLPKPVPDYSNFLNKGVKGLKIGIPREYFAQGIDSETESAIDMAIKKFQDLGAEVSEITLPYVKYSLAAYYLILPVEISANLSRYDGIRYGLSVPAEDLASVYYNTRAKGLGDEPKRRIMIGTYASSAGYYDAYYKKAKQVQQLIRNDFSQALSNVDLLLAPTTPTPAFLLGEKSADPLSMYLADIFTVAMNIAGVPAVSMPLGLSKTGLPLGMQLIASHFAEEKLLQAGHALEQALNFKLRPQI